MCLLRNQFCAVDLARNAAIYDLTTNKKILTLAPTNITYLNFSENGRVIAIG